MTEECSAVEHYVEKVTIWGDVEICYWESCSEWLRIGTSLKELHSGNLFLGNMGSVFGHLSWGNLLMMGPR